MISHIPGLVLGFWSQRFQAVKFIYSEKATTFCEISNADLFYEVPVKSTVEISQNFVAFSKYMNFMRYVQGGFLTMISSVFLIHCLHFIFHWNHILQFSITFYTIVKVICLPNRNSCYSQTCSSRIIEE